ncbi:MAG: Cys-tRNA(Pro) deacylase [Alistipes putredinis]|nr:MAG: Cys-tRNA(Pro) deacylase [Alistipes putredinis]
MWLRRLGEDIRQVFKTLVLRGDRTGIFVCVIPGDCETGLETCRKDFGQQERGDARCQESFLPTVGYIRGGCSPIGMKKRFSTFFHSSALDFDFIYVSAGVRGLQLKIAPEALIGFVGAQTGDLICR